MDRNADDMGAVDPGMRDAERSIDAVNEGRYDESRTEATSATTDHDVTRRLRPSAAARAPPSASCASTSTSDRSSKSCGR